MPEHSKSVILDKFLQGHFCGLQTLADISFNVTGPIDMSPGKIYEIPVDITVPPNSSLYGLVELTLPLDQSAVMTVLNVELVSFLLLLTLKLNSDLDLIRAGTMHQNINIFAQVSAISHMVSLNQCIIPALILLQHSVFLCHDDIF